MGTDKSVYLLVGDEGFLKEEWLKDIKQKLFKEKDASSLATDFNIFYIDKTIDLRGVLTLAKTKPFLTNKRLIVIKAIESLASPLDREQILNYLKSPSPDTILILEAGVSQKDFLNNKFLLAISKFSQVVPFKKLYDITLHNWISRRAILRKKRIEPKACELLRQLKGNNLKAIEWEIEKLSLYVSPRPLITQEDVRQFVGKDIESTIYDIIEAISQNDKRRVLDLSADFDKKDLGSTIGLFCWNLRLLLRVKEYLKAGWSLEKIGDSLGLKKFQLTRAVFQAKRLKTNWLKRAISELTEFDLQIKTSSFSGSFLGWQMLLVRLLERP